MLREDASGRSWGIDRTTHRRKLILFMDAIVEKLGCEVESVEAGNLRGSAVISEVINAADEDALDLMRSRAVEQEVLDSLDEPASR